jgi:hypothetical protein
MSATGVVDDLERRVGSVAPVWGVRSDEPRPIAAQTSVTV